ncbi:MAB_1171c family putative transporter [Micromonospora echinospora]|uniref:MAB_1171c family putative transporter n=1 Tax=Micromonospora echinospora TaxID=1877 RepID=UPI003A868B8F
MLVAVGHIVAALIAALALIVKLGALLRDAKNPRKWASAGICLGCGIAATAGWAPVHSIIDRISGVPNLAKLVEHGSALVTATAIQFLFLHLGDPQRARQQMRRRIVFLTLVFAAMTTMFWAADLRVSEPLHFAERYGHLPEMGIYMLAFLLYLGTSVTDTLRLSLGYARYAGTRLKWVMRLLSGGALFGAAYVGHKALFIAVNLAGFSAPWSEPLASQVLVTASVALFCLSFVLATIWKTADGVRAWPRRSNSYRQLHALWFLLYQAAPGISLHTPRRPERPAGASWGVGQRLYRRCVEIGDGLQALGPLDPEVKAAGRRRALEAGWAQDQADAAGEAAAILVAADRRRQGRVASRGVDPGLEPQPATVERPDVDADARWLAKVSSVLGEPLVKEAAAEALDVSAKG